MLALVLLKDEREDTAEECKHEHESQHDCHDDQDDCAASTPFAYIVLFVERVLDHIVNVNRQCRWYQQQFQEYDPEEANRHKQENESSNEQGFCRLLCLE